MGGAKMFGGIARKEIFGGGKLSVEISGERIRNCLRNVQEGKCPGTVRGKFTGGMSRGK